MESCFPPANSSHLEAFVKYVVSFFQTGKGKFSIMLIIVRLFLFLMEVFFIRYLFTYFMATYTGVRYLEREAILRDLFDTPKDQRDEKLLDLCFKYIERPEFQTDELLSHVEGKFSLGEKGRGDPVLQKIEEAERKPLLKDRKGETSMFQSYEDFLKMRLTSRSFHLTQDAVREIIDRAKEERAGVGRGDNWLEISKYNANQK